MGLGKQDDQMRGSRNLDDADQQHQRTDSRPWRACLLPATFTSNHCEYTFQNMTTAGTSWTATVDILCENPGEEMEIHVYENALKHKENVSLCTVKIPPQQDLGTVVFSNMAASEPADITINFTLSKMQFNVSGSILLCGMSSSNATYNGVFTMHAENLKGKPIPLTISGE
jgi:hypothetical protein